MGLAASLQHRNSVSHEKGETSTGMRQSNVVLSPRVYNYDVLDENVHVHQRSTKIQQVTFGPTETDSCCDLFFERKSVSTKKSAPRERSRYSSSRKKVESQLSRSTPRRSRSNLSEITLRSAENTGPRYDLRKKPGQSKYSAHPIRNDAVLTRKDSLADKHARCENFDFDRNFNSRQRYYTLHECTVPQNDSLLSNFGRDTQMSDHCDDSDCSDVTMQNTNKNQSWFQRNMQDRYLSCQDKSEDMGTKFNAQHHTAGERYSDDEDATSESLHLSQLEDNAAESRSIITHPVMYAWDKKFKRNRSNEDWNHCGNVHGKQVHFRDPISVTTSISSITLEDLGMNCDCNELSSGQDDDILVDSVEFHSTSQDLHNADFESPQKMFGIDTSTSENLPNIQQSQTFSSIRRDNISYQQPDKRSTADDSPSMGSESSDIQTIEHASKFIAEKNSLYSRDEKVISPERRSHQHSSQLGNFEDDTFTRLRSRFIKLRCKLEYFCVGC